MCLKPREKDDINMLMLMPISLRYVKYNSFFVATTGRVSGGFWYQKWPKCSIMHRQPVSVTFLEWSFDLPKMLNEAQKITPGRMALTPCHDIRKYLY